jgi:mercuric ion transport protein
LLAGLAASVCCIGPLVLTLLGVSGAAALAKLDVIRWPMIGAVAVLFALAGRSLYRKRNSCEPGSLCADPKKWRQMAMAYWLGLAAAGLAITSPYWIALIYG